MDLLFCLDHMSSSGTSGIYKINGYKIAKLFYI